MCVYKTKKSLSYHIIEILDEFVKLFIVLLLLYCCYFCKFFCSFRQDSVLSQADALTEKERGKDKDIWYIGHQIRFSFVFHTFLFLFNICSCWFLLQLTWQDVINQFICLGIKENQNKNKQAGAKQGQAVIGLYFNFL